MLVFKSWWSSRPDWRTLRTFLLLLLCALIPIVVMGGILGQSLTDKEKAALDDAIYRKASRYGFALSRELETHIQLLSVLSESPRLDPPFQTAEFTKIAERLRVRIPVWEYVRLTDLRGNIVVSVPALADRSRTNTVVDLESHNAVVAAASALIGNISRGPHGLPAFPIRVPVLRQGKVVAILSAVIRPQAVINVFKANGLPEGWVGWVEDNKGRLVAASTSQLALLGGPAAAFVKHEQSGEMAFLTGEHVEGQKLRISLAPVAGSNWTVYCAMPLSRYAQATQRGFLTMLAVGSFALLLSLAAVFLFMRELRARRRDEEAIASGYRLDALGKLTGGIAHDINNLLMVFQSGTESIKRRRNDERRVDQILEGMQQAVARGKTLTQRLLQFSRRSNQDAETISIYARSPSITDLLRQAAQDTVILITEFEPALWEVTVDPGAFETALINLVTNGREAMPEGGDITVTARNVQEMSAETPKLKGPGVAITVSDGGSGITPDVLPRVFEPFFTTKPDGGPGLGLSQVYSFALRSGGVVTIASVPGRGSAFTIYLPRAKSSVDAADRKSAITGELPRSILVVDDNATSLAVTKSALEDHGIEVTAASSGSAALDILRRQHNFQVVLTDIRMPGMSGIQLAHVIQRDYPAIGVSLMTGYSEELESGISVSFPVLTKPFTQERLIEALLQASSRTNVRLNVLSFRK